MLNLEPTNMLNQLQPTHKLKSEKRIGRGGKRGTTSGRGQKGQKSRAGHRIRPAFRDTILRIPKLRGFGNKSIKSKPQIVSLADLSRLPGNEVTYKTLVESGLIRKGGQKRVKILGSGEVKKSFLVRGVSASKSAEEIIVRAGGRVDKQ